MSALRQRSGGFTLLELIIVVVVIGILASVALPRYLRVAEKARVADAKHMLGALRAAQIRYSIQFSAYCTAIDSLDLPSSSWTSSKYFTPNIDAVSGPTNDDDTVVAWATRTAREAVAGFDPFYVLNITQGGVISAPSNEAVLL